jgi:hypothetical protein
MLGLRQTHISPYDNGQLNRGRHNQLTFGDGKVIWRPIHVPLLNVNLMGITKLMIVIHGQSLQMLE